MNSECKNDLPDRTKSFALEIIRVMDATSDRANSPTRCTKSGELPSFSIWRTIALPIRFLMQARGPLAEQTRHKSCAEAVSADDNLHGSTSFALIMVPK
jgi:hypothetical protein